MRARFLISLILVLVTAVVFGPSVGYRFVGWDDDIHVYQNPYLNPPTLGHALQFWKGPHQALYIPLTFTAWSLIVRISQPFVSDGTRIVFDPRWFHAANVLVHLLTVLLVYFLLLFLLPAPGMGEHEVRPYIVGRDGCRGDLYDRPGPGGSRACFAALLGALLYAVHPLQVEPVCWVSSLKDLLCGFFSALALLQFIQLSQTGDPPFTPGSREAPRRKKRLIIGATLSFVLALFSKPAALAVPAIAWLLGLWVNLSDRPEEVRGKKLLPSPIVIVWLILAIPFMVLAKTAEKDIPLGDVVSWRLRPLVALDALAFYLGKLPAPVGLGIDYGRTTAWVMERGWVWFTWLLPVLLVGVLLLLKERRRWLIALGIFAAGVAPTLGLVPHGYQVFSNVADRFLYLSMLGPALAFAWLNRSSSARPIRVISLALVVLWGGWSIVQRTYWKDNIRLFNHALAINARSYMAHYNLGITLSDADAGEERLLAGEEALRHYREAVRIKPDYARAYNNLGALLDVRGRHAEAIEAYRMALRLTPGDAKVPYNLGLALIALGKTDEAIASYEAALRLRPDYPEVHNSLGLACAGQGESDQAIAHYREAIRLSPGSFMAMNNLGIVLADRGDLTGAIAAYRGAIRVSPRYPDAYSNLGNALASAGKIDEAMASYREAIRLQPDYAMAHNNLGTAFARLEKIEEARKCFERALQLDPNCRNAKINLSRLPLKSN